MISRSNLPLGIAAALLLVLVACAPAAQPAAPAPAAPAAPAQPKAPAPAVAPSTPTPVVQAAVGGATPTPKTGAMPTYGGVLTQHLAPQTSAVEFDSFGASVVVSSYYSPIWNNLFEYVNLEHEFTPSLAESWETKDGKTYTFRLRKDVTWHDGKPFTSADVTATWDLMMNKTTSAAGTTDTARFFTGSGAKGTPVKWRAVDAYTVEVVLPEPSYLLLPIISAVGQNMVAKHIIDKYKGQDAVYPLTAAFKNNEVVGTGPFTLDKYIRDVEYNYKRNPKYFKKDASGNQLPYLDGIKMTLIRDASLRFAAFRTGQTMIWPAGYPNVSNSDAGNIKKQLGDKVVVIPGNAMLNEHVYYNNSRPLIKDVEFRWAINLIIDRHEIGERAAGGNFIVGILDPGLYGNAALPMAEVLSYPGFRRDKTQDHAEARKILADKYGITPQKPLDLLMVNRNYGVTGDIGPVLVQQLAPFGIRVRLDAKDIGAVTQDYQSGALDLAPDLNSARTYDPYLFMTQHYNTKMGTREVRTNIWESPNQDKVTEWLREVVVTLDPAKRNEIWRKIQLLLYTEIDSQPIATLGWEGTNYMWWSKVNFTELVGGSVEGQRHDRTWISK